MTFVSKGVSKRVFMAAKEEGNSRDKIKKKNQGESCTG
jgi:hypothetical protein